MRACTGSLPLKILCFCGFWPLAHEKIFPLRRRKTTQRREEKKISLPFPSFSFFEIVPFTIVISIIKTTRWVSIDVEATVVCLRVLVLSRRVCRPCGLAGVVVVVCGDLKLAVCACALFAGIGGWR